MRRMLLPVAMIVVAAIAVVACSSGGSTDDDSGMPMSHMSGMMSTNLVTETSRHP